MEIGFDLTDLLREAEDDCPQCGGIGVRECGTCHGKAKVLNHTGRWLVQFIARYSDEIAAAQHSAGVAASEGD